MRVKSVVRERCESTPVYDIVNASPCNNFLVKTSTGYIVSHNCCIDELNFAQGQNVAYQKSRIMDLYNNIRQRLNSRFIVNGKNYGKLFLVSSKATEYSFLEAYIADQKSKGYPIYVVDKPRWEVKPFMYSGKTFKVAVGNKYLPSRIVPENLSGDSLKAYCDGLIAQGLRIIDVPIEEKQSFDQDIDRALQDAAGIATSVVTKAFNSYKVSEAISDTLENPFTNEIVTLGLNDDLQLKDFFDASKIPDNVIGMPVFVHLDASLKGDRTGLAGVAVIGTKTSIKKNMESSEIEEESVDELVCQEVFHVGIEAPADSEISFEKTRQFIYYLRDEVGLNIRLVTSDGFQSADFRQILSTKGFEVGYTSLDRTPDGYDGLRSAIYDKRIILLKNNEILYDELTNLERDNMSRKYDHPINSSKDTCLSGDTKLFLLSGKELTIEELYNSDYLDEWVLSCDKENQKVVPVKIEGVVQKDYIPKILYKITLDNNEQFSVTGNHKILLRDGSYKRADELSVGESLMPFNVYKEFRYKDYYRKVVNPFTNKSDWIYQLVVHSIKQDEFDSVRLDLDGSPYKVIHHQDHNKLNDSPSNLKPMTLKAHRKLHGDIFKKYNTSDAKRKRNSELALERKVGFGYIYDTFGPDSFKKNGTRQITKYNKSEKHRRETSERNIRTNAWLYMKGTSHTPEANAKRRATRNALGYDKAFSQQVSLQNQDPVIKHNQQLGKVKKMYQIILDNSDLFNKSNVTFEDFLKEIDVLKAKGVISQHFYCKKDYGLFIEAGIPLTNHKIINIEVIQNYQPVYDLQLSMIHNFGISAGVFVHNCDALAGAHMDAMQYKDEFMFFHPDDYDYEGLNSSISEEEKMRDSLIKSISPSNQKVDSGKTLPSDFYNDAILNVENNVQNFSQKNKKLDPSDIFADIDSSSYGNDDDILWL